MFPTDTPLHASLNPDPVRVAEPQSEHRLAPAVEIDEFAFEDPVKEARFQAAWRFLKNTPDPRAKPNWLVFFVLLAVVFFLIFPAGNFHPLHLSLLVAVILLHELGHLAAMKAFHYTDGKLFFIPIFTLAVLGKKHAAPAWQQALVILAGPFPGLALALAWYAMVGDEAAPWELYAIILLLAINLIQLLPIEPFDGGRLLNLILFSRNVWFETAMKLATAISLGWLAYLHTSPLLGVIGLFTLMSIPFHFRKGLMISRLRREGLHMPETVAELQPLHGRMLFAAAYDVLKNRQVGDSVMAVIMRDLHDRVLVPPPRLLPTLGFCLLYAATFALGIGTLLLMAHDIVTLNQQVMKLEFERAILKQDIQRETVRTRRLAGQAQEAARTRLKAMHTRLLDKDERLAQLREKMDKFHAVLPLPAGGLDRLDDEADRQEDQDPKD